MARRIAEAYNARKSRPQPAGPPSMYLQNLSVGVALWLALSGAAWAQDVALEASPVWQKVRADLFSGMPIATGDNVIVLETPKRAEDAAVVPIAIRAQFPQAENRYIAKIWLIIDNNPSPIAAIFAFTRASGRADIETRIRVEQYTPIRAIALTNDGTLHM